MAYRHKGEACDLISAIPKADSSVQKEEGHEVAVNCNKCKGSAAVMESASLVFRMLWRTVCIDQNL